MAEKNLIGKNILGYNVDEKIGSGGFGTVYKVSKHNPSGSYTRALKHITIPTQKQYNAILNSMGGDYSKADNYFAKVLQDIVSEIKILNSLSNKGVLNIVRYYENDITENKEPYFCDVYILMEYLTPFTDFLECNELTVEEVINLGLDILSALKVCHQNGIIHRDIKEDNIFVTDNKDFKLGDFGVSKVLKDKSKAESMKGTPNFIAPEVYLGKESYNNSVDLYSLGIVLYKLLNYSRNPFLPKYPLPYDQDDEDKAFEERMKGEIPNLPENGGVELGNIIIKSISNKEQRYQSAEVFYNDLVKAKQRMLKSELDKKINMVFTQKSFTTDLSNEMDDPRTYGETVGEDYRQVQNINNKKNKTTSDYNANKDLFKTFAQSYNTPPKETKKDVYNYNENSVMNDSKQPYVDNNTINREVVKPIERKSFTWVIYLLPFVLATIGVILFFVMVPKIYGNSVSFVQWLFSDIDDVLKTLQEPNIVLPKIYSIIFLRIGIYVLTILFITSLFFVGKQLQRKKEPIAEGAVLKGKDAYYLMMKISSDMKEIQRKFNQPEISKLSYDVKRLDEKMSIESDFGCSNFMVTDIENEIVQYLYFIQDTIKSIIMSNNIDGKIEIIESYITKISMLLKQRTEMKKR